MKNLQDDKRLSCTDLKRISRSGGLLRWTFHYLVLHGNKR